MGIKQNRLWIWNGFTKELTFKPPLSIMLAMSAGIVALVVALLFLKAIF